MSSTRLRVLTLCSSLSNAAGGIYGVQKSHAKYCQSLGVQVIAAGIEDSRWNSDRHEWQGIDANVFPCSFPKFYRRSTGLANFVNEKGPAIDLVHLHGLWHYPSFLTRRLQTKFKKPSIVSPHGMLEGWALQNSSWKKRLVLRLFERKMLETATCIHALNEGELNDIRKLGLRNPVCILPNGVENRIACLPLLRKQEVLFIGRLHPKKGLVNLINAWSMMPDEILKAWKLRIIGWDDGGHERELESLVRTMSLEGSVSMNGPLFGVEKQKVLDEARLFILPSKSEGLPIAVLEAWESGLPVIMTPQCNLDIGFRSGCAIQVDITADSIAKGLLKFFDQTESEQVEMGRKGMRLVADSFTWPRIAEQLLSVYQWIVHGDCRPSCVHLDA
jgi:poly(glycerol-phosphate) alpha-glucosyltransferase